MFFSLVIISCRWSFGLITKVGGGGRFFYLFLMLLLVATRQCGKKTRTECMSASFLFYFMELYVTRYHNVLLFFQTGLNPCKENPCKNGGVCKLKHYDYFCICPPMFGGKQCELGECGNARTRTCILLKKGLRVSFTRRHLCWLSVQG